MTTTPSHSAIRRQLDALDRRLRAVEAHVGVASPPERCPECDGAGSFAAGSRNPDKRPMLCVLCQGTGRCPDGYWDDDWTPPEPPATLTCQCETCGALTARPWAEIDEDEQYLIYPRTVCDACARRTRTPLRPNGLGAALIAAVALMVITLVADAAGALTYHGHTWPAIPGASSCAITRAWEDGSALAHCADGAVWAYDPDGQPVPGIADNPMQTPGWHPAP